MPAASAIAVHGRTAEQSYSGPSDWDFISRIAESVDIPVFGSGDVIEPEQAIERLRTTAVSGVLIGRGVLRNPWILSQAQALAEGRTPVPVTIEQRGRFLLDYLDLLLAEGDNEAVGFRHSVIVDPALNPSAQDRVARGRDRWVINKLRALGSWYTKGLDNGSHLRTAINKSESLGELRDVIAQFFFEGGALTDHRAGAMTGGAAAFEG